MINKLFLVFFLLIFSIPGAFANDILKVDVDVIGDIVSINVPDRIYLGNISKGFKTSEVKIFVNNSGNTNLRLSPVLQGSYDPAFENLYMQRILSDQPKRYSQFTVNVTKPSQLNGLNSESFYVLLDLTNYTGSLGSGVNRKTADVKFVTTIY